MCLNTISPKPENPKKPGLDPTAAKKSASKDEVENLSPKSMPTFQEETVLRASRASSNQKTWDEIRPRPSVSLIRHVSVSERRGSLFGGPYSKGNPILFGVLILGHLIFRSPPPLFRSGRTHQAATTQLGDDRVDKECN